MKIVYICDFFHPEAGYHPNLLSKYWTKFGHEVIILTSELDKMPVSLTHFFNCTDIIEKDQVFEKQNRVKIIRLPIYCFISGRSIYKPMILKVIKGIAPDVVYVNGNDTFIGILLTCLYKWGKYGLVLDSHMLDIASNNRFKSLFRWFYKTFIAKIIIKNKIPVIRAQNDGYIEKFLGIPLKDSPWISFGADMLLFHPDEKAKPTLRMTKGIKPKSFVILYAGKISKVKGMDLFSEAIRLKFHSEKDVCIIVIGATEGEEGKIIEESLAKSENNVIRFPTQKHIDLPQFYQLADLAVFPKQCSLSFFDVQACGLPVVFEDNNINLERGRAGNAKTFESNNADQLRDTIESFINMPSEEFIKYKQNSIDYVTQNYNYEKKAEEYLPYLEKQKNNKRTS